MLQFVFWEWFGLCFIYVLCFLHIFSWSLWRLFSLALHTCRLNIRWKLCWNFLFSVFKDCCILCLLVILKSWVIFGFICHYCHFYDLFGRVYGGDSVSVGHHCSPSPAIFIYLYFKQYQQQQQTSKTLVILFK